MPATNDQLLTELRDQRKIQAAHHAETMAVLADHGKRLRELEDDRARRAGAKGVVLAILGMGAGTWLWSLFANICKHGGK